MNMRLTRTNYSSSTSNDKHPAFEATRDVDRCAFLRLRPIVATSTAEPRARSATVSTIAGTGDGARRALSQPAQPSTNVKSSTGTTTGASSSASRAPPHSPSAARRASRSCAAPPVPPANILSFVFQRVSSVNDAFFNPRAPKAPLAPKAERRPASVVVVVVVANDPASMRTTAPPITRVAVVLIGVVAVLIDAALRPSTMVAAAISSSVCVRPRRRGALCSTSLACFST